MGNRCEQGLHSSCTAVGHRGVTGGHRGSPRGHRRRSSVDVPMCSYGQGSIRAATGTTLGILGTSKMKENKRFYGFTDYRGKPARRGRVGHAPANQVTAGRCRGCAVSRVRLEAKPGQEPDVHPPSSRQENCHRGHEKDETLREGH